MKALFLTPTSLNEYSGIDKKVIAQYEALKENGLDIELCYIDRKEDAIERKIFQKNILLKKIKLKNKILKKFFTLLLKGNFKDVENYIFKNRIGLLYIRYEMASNYGFIKFLKNLRDKNIKILVEIPTFPYDQELLNGNFRLKLRYFIDKYYRKKLKKFVDKIVTFSEDKKIYGIPTINISNGIDINKISLVEKKESKKIRFIGIAGLMFWHGFDRFILSMKEFYKTNPNQEIIFNIVGDGNKDYVNKLKNIVKENKLENYVIFHGLKSGRELDKIYNNSDIGVSSLGAHRKKIYKGSALKNVEYAAKGLPFILSDIDKSFDNCSFVYQASQDEKLLDIEKIIEWYKNLELDSQEIRKYVENNLTWDIQMKKVINELEIDSDENISNSRTSR